MAVPDNHKIEAGHVGVHQLRIHIFRRTSGQLCLREIQFLILATAREHSQYSDRWCQHHRTPDQWANDVASSSINQDWRNQTCENTAWVYPCAGSRVYDHKGKRMVRPPNWQSSLHTANRLAGKYLLRHNWNPWSPRDSGIGRPGLSAGPD